MNFSNLNEFNIGENRICMVEMKFNRNNINNNIDLLKFIVKKNQDYLMTSMQRKIMINMTLK